MRVLLIGAGGREAAIAKSLLDSNNGSLSLWAFLPHRNPSLLAAVESSGGQLAFGEPSESEKILAFAKNQQIDLAVVSSDPSLAAGVVDTLVASGIRTFGPSKNASEIEWNKAFARNLSAVATPEAVPEFLVVLNRQALESSLAKFQEREIPVVVKPSGLTGGKGVKVMGEHLGSYKDCANYALQILDAGNSVVLEEKMEGIEFTFQAFSDGTNLCPLPLTYDHSYRFENDRGPGTGGMGSFCDHKLHLPFLGPEVFEQCVAIVEKTLAALKQGNRIFQGIIYGGFFLTKRGLKIVEFNARFGDPESINVLSVLETPLLQILEAVVDGAIGNLKLKFKDEASVVKYLVSPDYAIKKGPSYDFAINFSKDFDANFKQLKVMDCNLFFSAAEESAAVEDLRHYRTIGTSRSLAVQATAESIPQAALKVDQAIAAAIAGPLQMRSDIGSAEELLILSDRIR